MSAGSATTSGGYATSTFSATGNAGTVVITAVSGDISETVSIDILQSPAQSIEFISGRTTTNRLVRNSWINVLGCDI